MDEQLNETNQQSMDHKKNDLGTDSDQGSIINDQNMDEINDFNDEELAKEAQVKKKPGFFSKKCSNCEKVETEREEYKAGWQRAQADYQNLQREVERQKTDWALWSELRILEEFIPVYEHFKKAFYHADNVVNGGNDEANTLAEAMEKHWLNWKKGIEYIMKQFGDILKAHGVEEIKTVGEAFDPVKHEAIGEEESSTAPEHQIVREIEGGYMLKGKVIRVAKVVVAMAKS